MRSLAIAAALTLAWAASRRAEACATCNCGDPTLTATGVEQPYRNRVRAMVEARTVEHDTGDELAGAREQAWALRTSALIAWSPLPRLTLAAQLPWLTEWLRTDRGQETVGGLGDLEVSLRGVVLRDRRFAPRHLLSLVGGLKLPTGPFLRDSHGYPVADDDQPGTGSWDPFAGVSYAFFTGGLVSAFASAGYRVGTPGRRDYRRGSILTYAAWAQLQPFTWGALQVGVDGRYATADQVEGRDVPDTGGAVVRFMPALLASPRTDLLIRLAVAVPIVQVWNGRQKEGAEAGLSIIYDIH